MQNENFKELTNENFSVILQNAQKGDNASLEMILEFFKDDINSMCKYIKVPKEDVVQELYAELITLIRSNNKG